MGSQSVGGDGGTTDVGLAYTACLPKNLRNECESMHGAMLISAVCVVACVFLHLGILRFLWISVLPRLRTLSRIPMGLMVLGTIAAHLLEIVVFAGGTYVITLVAPVDHAKDDPAFVDYGPLYYSAVSFTSMGGSRRRAGTCGF